jgi:hypothetical protein
MATSRNSVTIGRPAEEVFARKLPGLTSRRLSDRSLAAHLCDRAARWLYADVVRCSGSGLAAAGRAGCGQE